MNFAECIIIHYYDNADHYFCNTSKANYITLFKDDSSLQIFLWGNKKYYVYNFTESDPLLTGIINSDNLEQAFLEANSILYNYANNLIFL
jgi:hypothetical protein